jgi:hypothetical protein
VEALQEAMARFGQPDVFNTDQGVQFTSAAFLDELEGCGVRISMDGKGRFLDNIWLSAPGTGRGYPIGEESLLADPDACPADGDHFKEKFKIISRQSSVSVCVRSRLKRPFCLYWSDWSAV